MKKGYIVSWFNCGQNYGQTLQAYALQKTIYNMGYDVAHICFGLNFDPRLSIRKSVYEILKMNHFERIVQSKFDRFIKKNMRTTSYFMTYYDIKQFLQYSKPDFLLCGSDQIWNPYNVDPIYYLYGLGDEKTKKIAYAVSLCDEKRKEKYYETPDIAKWIQGINKIFTRENSGKTILEDMFNIHSEVVLDPTILLYPEQWIEYLRLKKMREKYILCYAFNLNETQKEIIEDAAQKNDCAIKYGNILMKDIKGIKKEPWSPVDFLENIYNAEMVFTDSFHGMVFSILFHKEFLVFDNGNDEEGDPYYNIDRMVTILQELELSNRIYSNTMTCLGKPIDYSFVNSILDKRRKECTDLLRESIG